MKIVDLNDLTLGQIKEIQSLCQSHIDTSKGLCSMVGMKVIVRTYSAGVHFGTLQQKSGNEVILENARRLRNWHAAEGICVHGIAKYGIIAKKSTICAPVELLWLEAIEIVPCTEISAKSIEEAQNA